jgi:hypothetical protein
MDGFKEGDRVIHPNSAIGRRCTQINADKTNIRKDKRLHKKMIRIFTTETLNSGSAEI